VVVQAPVRVEKVLEVALALKAKGRDRAQEGLGRVQVEKVRALVGAVKAKAVRERIYLH
jgi:hypothetical protein